MSSIISEKIKSDSYIFIDYSNIYIGFYNYIMYNHKKYNICNPKMDYNKLFSIIENDKKFKKKILVGSKSSKKTKNNIKEKKIFKQLGYEIIFLERINNKEEGVDDILHENILNILSIEKPGTIIIATGDGKKGDYTDNSFYNICVNALNKGWNIKIISWKNQISKKYIIGSELCNILKDDNIRNKFDILYLDKYVEMLIF